MSLRPLRIAIIGAGPGGLCMGKRLLDEGFDEFVILERADDLGGTWYHHRYPGCECATPAIVYAFSFERITKGSNVYLSQSQVLDYLRSIADKYDLRSHCRFGDGVTAARWGEDTSTWTLTLDSGETLVADAVVSAIGVFNELRWPEIEGLDKFKGSIWHTARWDNHHDLSQDRIAVIGSGDSAVQVVPELVKVSSQVHLFQRTPNYIQPKQGIFHSPEEYQRILNSPEKYLQMRTTYEQSISTFADNSSDPIYRASFESSGLGAISVVHDPEVRRKLHPTYAFGLSRIFCSNAYYPAFNEPNLELVTDPIASVGERSIVTSDGVERVVDTIVLATGYDAPKYLRAFDVIGRDGQQIDTAWADGPIAYLGIMTSGFPNLFMLFGPNTYADSVPVMIEAQVNYILAHLGKLVQENVASVDVKTEAMIRHDNVVQAALRGVPEWKVEKVSNRLWSEGNIKVWPFTMSHYRWLTSKIDPNAFSTRKRVKST